jgi:VWFA-related protein
MSTRAMFVLLLVLAPGLAPATRSQGEPPGTTFPSGVELVNVDAVVLDAQGRPVEGLTPADFTVSEDGQPETITRFEALALAESPSEPSRLQRISTNTEPPPARQAWFVVVYDDANLSQYASPHAREAIVGFLTRGLRRGDQVMIVPTSGGAWWTGQIPEDREGLVAFVGHLDGTRRPDTTPAHIWDYEAMTIANDRDPSVLGEVARRYFENNLIPEAYPQDPVLARDLDVSPGLPMIRAKAREVYREATVRIRTTLDVLERVAAALGQLRGRKTLLLVSEGFIMDPTQPEFRDLLRAARNANAAVSFIDARGPTGFVGQAGMAGGGAEYGRMVEERDTTTMLGQVVQEQAGARSVALDTGGSIVSGTADLTDGMARIAAESRAYYLLGYTSTNTARDGKFRKIQVTVSRPNVEVRARRGYYAPSDKEERPVPKDQLDPVVRAGLDAPYGQPGIPLRLTSYTFEPQTGGKVHTVLVAEADLGPLHLQPHGGRYSATLDSYVVVSSRDKGAIEKQETRLDLDMPSAVFDKVERGVPIRREFSLDPGVYQARLLLRDRASARLGSVLHEFEVPKADSLRLSTPLLTDTLQPGANGEPPRPLPIARRTFRAGSRIVCAFEIYGAAPGDGQGGRRVTVAYRLRGPGGREVSASPPELVPAAPDGRLSKIIVLSLPPAAEGEHELELTVRDEVSSTTVEDSEPFVVSRG